MLLFARPSASSGAPAAFTRSALPNLPRLVSEQCQSLSPCPPHNSGFRSSPLLRTGHLQTLYSAMKDTAHLDKVPFHRKIIITPDGGTISLDITAFPRDGELATIADHDDETPTLIVTHGLTGGSSESYVRSVLHPLCSPPSQGGKGYRAVVVNSRGCAHTPVTSAQLYSASKTADVRCALLWATKHYPNAPLIGMGFSLGANFIAKATGEDGDETPLVSVIPIGAPWDLLRGSEALEGDGPGGSPLSSTYSTVMAGNLKAVIGSHAATLALHTPLKPHLAALFKPAKNKTEYYQFCKEHQEADADGEWSLPAGKPEPTHLVTPKTLRHVDDTITRLGGGHSAPYGEFPLRSAKAYYLQGGAGQVHLLQNVRIPMLALNADDDPIVPLPVLAGVFEILGEHAKDIYNKLASKLRLPLHVASHPSRAEAELERQKWEEQSILDPRAHPGLVPNENIVLALTRGGGHLGWWTSIRAHRAGCETRSTRWLPEPVGEWVDMIARRVERARELARAESQDRDLLNGKSVLASEDDRREREWAFRSMTRSLWRQDEQAAAASHPRRIREVDVQIELVDVDRMPVYDFDTSDLRSSTASSTSATTTPISPLRSKVPFLLTPVLEHVPLVHPRHASVGWHEDAERRRPLFEGEWELGRLLNLTMYLDSQHPEVGFAELPLDTQVAGIGTLFDGGSEVPGQSEEEAEWIKKNAKKSWYKGRRKQSRQAEVVRGL
ncbi:hypothetical protein OC842_003748 [Tilletia horrida]|uniref:AB hydrolase-1 domain-containing protein n=1 Tax=Tilletia horrida TaxID=155126 RepID=A0AAN6GAY6_9BASI|nr:hypothetical protein OC842_003748 [Tilletia horrida]